MQGMQRRTPPPCKQEAKNLLKSANFLSYPRISLCFEVGNSAACKMWEMLNASSYSVLNFETFVVQTDNHWRKLKPRSRGATNQPGNSHPATLSNNKERRSQRKDPPNLRTQTNSAHKQTTNQPLAIIHPTNLLISICRTNNQPWTNVLHSQSSKS
jgi:hypothetical protein